MCLCVPLLRRHLYSTITFATLTEIALKSCLTNFRTTLSSFIRIEGGLKTIVTLNYLYRSKFLGPPLTDINDFCRISANNLRSPATPSLKTFLSLSLAVTPFRCWARVPRIAFAICRLQGDFWASASKPPIYNQRVTEGGRARLERRIAYRIPTSSTARCAVCPFSPSILTNGSCKETV